MISNRWKILAAALPIIGTLAVAQPQPGGLGGFFQAAYSANLTTTDWLPSSAQGNVLAYWRPGITGDATDTVGTNNLPAFGDAYEEIGTGFVLDGSADYYEIVNSSSINASSQYTLMAWARHDSSAPMVAIEKWDGSFPVQYIIYYAYNINSGSYMGYSSNPIYTAGGLSSATGTWNFVAAVNNGSDMFMYQNDNSVVSEIGNHTYATDTGNFAIGRRPSSGSYYWNGAIDEVILLDRALSESEIQEYYNNSYNAEFSTR